VEVREPVGPVQVLPPGLINLLQLKVGGYVPDALRQDIQPTIDLEAWWLRAARKVLPGAYTNGVAAAAVDDQVGIFTTGLVSIRPGDKAWWYVHRASVLGLANGGAVTVQQLCVRTPGGTSAFANDALLMYGDFLPTQANGTYHLHTAGGFWMPPGSSLGMYVGTIAAGTLELVLLGFEYTELAI